MEFQYKTISKLEKVLFIICGAILELVTLCWGHHVWGGYFFSHEVYINRKRLVIHMTKYGLPTFRKISHDDLYIYEWHLADNVIMLFWPDHRFSLHRDEKTLMKSAFNGMLDEFYVQKIKSLLRNAV